MKILERTDLYNSSKIWVIKITRCNHFYVNQKIKGNMIYPKFQKMNKRQLLDIGLNL